MCAFADFTILKNTPCVGGKPAIMSVRGKGGPSGGASGQPQTQASAPAAAATATSAGAAAPAPAATTAAAPAKHATVVKRGPPPAAEPPASGPLHVTPEVHIVERGYIDLSEHMASAGGLAGAPATRRPRELKISIHVPAVRRADELELEVDTQVIKLKTVRPLLPAENGDSAAASSGRREITYQLEHRLPYPVNAEETRAKLDKHKGALLLTALVLPLQVPPPPTMNNASTTRADPPSSASTLAETAAAARSDGDGSQQEIRADDDERRNGSREGAPAASHVPPVATSAPPSGPMDVAAAHSRWVKQRVTAAETATAPVSASAPAPTAPAAAAAAAAGSTAATPHGSEPASNRAATDDASAVAAAAAAHVSSATPAAFETRAGGEPPLRWRQNKTSVTIIFDVPRVEQGSIALEWDGVADAAAGRATCNDVTISFLSPAAPDTLVAGVFEAEPGTAPGSVAQPRYLYSATLPLAAGVAPARSTVDAADHNIVVVLAKATPETWPALRRSVAGEPSSSVATAVHPTTAVLRAEQAELQPALPASAPAQVPASTTAPVKKATAAAASAPAAAAAAPAPAAAAPAGSFAPAPTGGSASRAGIAGTSAAPHTGDGAHEDADGIKVRSGPPQTAVGAISSGGSHHLHEPPEEEEVFELDSRTNAFDISSRKPAKKPAQPQQPSPAAGSSGRGSGGTQTRTPQSMSGEGSSGSAAPKHTGPSSMPSSAAAPARGVASTPSPASSTSATKPATSAASKGKPAAVSRTLFEID